MQEAHHAATRARAHSSSSSSRPRRTSVPCAPSKCTANLRTKIQDFRGFDSSRILVLRVGIIMFIGVFPETLGQLRVGIFLVGRLGVACPHSAPGGEILGAGRAEISCNRWCDLRLTPCHPIHLSFIASAECKAAEQQGVRVTRPFRITFCDFASQDVLKHSVFLSRSKRRAMPGQITSNDFSTYGLQTCLR